MLPPDAIGYLASGLVLATFCMRHMGPLRATALCSNVAFIAYAVQGGVGPAGRHAGGFDDDVDYLLDLLNIPER
ncbi:hypothetical protein [Paracraurococcus lichenis]|uniref:Uncharacterized protein n=1 Tax=Paracraurococcus lichenis TaxID=3064888 RepID=A0ABT9EAL3_9PROT|nr:hypothetical protein [Paracraurococcus sp. LOR1-02]MDO9713208.1 hypothetical protein [Paracraurococcus sp. LOR1-02]